MFVFFFLSHSAFPIHAELTCNLYLQANIGATRQLKGKMKKAKFEAFRIYPVDGKSVHNYSSQSLNSAELAKKYLRQEMAKVN